MNYRFELIGTIDGAEVQLRDPNVEGYAVTVTARRTRDGTWEASGLSVESPDGPPPVSATTFREIGVGNLIRSALQELHAQGTGSESSAWDVEPGTGVPSNQLWIESAQLTGQDHAGFESTYHFSQDGEVLLSLDGWKMPELVESETGDLQLPIRSMLMLRERGPSSRQAAWAVATAARFCESVGIPVTKGISDILGLPYSTASHWLKLARQSGWVPASGRRSGRGR